MTSYAVPTSDHGPACRKGYAYPIDEPGVVISDCRIIPRGYVTHGRVVTITFATRDPDAANRWMGDHVDDGVVAVVDGEILIASCDDLGVRLASAWP